MAAFVFFQIMFSGPLNMGSEEATLGALAATVLVVFLWTRFAAKFGL